MISSLQKVAGSIPAMLALEGAIPAGPSRAQSLLSTFDLILAVLAAVCALGVFLWCAMRSAPDPLRDAPPRPNRLREDALALAVLFYLSAAALVSAIVHLAIGPDDSVVSTVVIGNLAQLAGSCACLIIAATRFDGGVRRFFAAESSPRWRVWVAATVGPAVVAMGLCPVVNDAAMYITLQFSPDYQFSSHPTMTALHDPARSAGMMIALWGGAAVLAPIAEELFFRGLLQTWLVTVVQNRWLAIALASAAFGAVHFQQPHAIPALCVLGLLIGYSYERTGALAPPILIHAAFNLKTLIWDALGGFPT